MFENLQNFRVEGGGTGIIDGNGRKWWDNSCKVNESLVSHIFNNESTLGASCFNFCFDYLLKY